MSTTTLNVALFSNPLQPSLQQHEYAKCPCIIRLLSAYLKYTREILPKAERCLETQISKSLESKMDFEPTNMKYGDPVVIENLISIILYCDYTALCTDFSKSFRKSHRFELQSHMKQRAAKYYHLGRSLMETITCYGKNGSTERGNGALGQLKGPFYTGMSMVMKEPQFNILFTFSKLDLNPY